MNNKRQISIIALLIAVLAGIASFIGIFLQFGDGSFIYQSIRGHDIEIYGRGIYQHMSSDVAVQGIAQDYVVKVKTSSDSKAFFASTEAKRFLRHILPE